MSVAEDDWLSNEKFDFDVTVSPVTGGACLLGDENFLKADEVGDDEEEVFFGPQTFKEKVVATVVKEKEAIMTTSIGSLNPEEQALVLRESALLSLMIKHGTSNNFNKSSPIAVVHPMKREHQEGNNSDSLIKDSVGCKTFDKANKENTKPVIKSSSEIGPILSKKTNIEQNSKMSKVLQPKLSVKPRASSNPEAGIAMTKLPVPTSRAMIHSDLSKPVVDPAILYGLSNDTCKSVRRRSALSVKQEQTENGTLLKQSKPPILRSAMPSTRIKVPSSSTVESKLMPMKATGIPLPPTSVPKSQIKPAGSRKSIIASQGTPSKATKAPLVESALKRQNSFDSKLSTPGMKAIAKLPQSSKRSNELVTPVQRTPSTRKSISGRQLLLKKTQGESESKTPSPVGSDCLNTERITSQVTALEVPNSELKHINTSAVAPTHCDIMKRYRKLKEMQASTTQLTIDDSHTVVKSPECLEGDAATEKVTNLSPTALDEMEGESLMLIQPLQPTDSPLLKLSPMKVSPVKSEDNFLDPFHTGRTPPPLIDISDVLEPERPKETNLIEF